MSKYSTMLLAASLVVASASSARAAGSPFFVSPENATPPAVEEGQDHAGVVNHYGVTFFAPSRLSRFGSGGSSAGGSSAGGSSIVVEEFEVLPIGVRYWYSKSMGVDLGLGLRSIGGGTTEKKSGATTETDEPSAFGFALHGGVPFVVSTGAHYKFLTIPELDFGYGKASRVDGSTTTSLSSWTLAIGGRVGAEVHLGFMRLPQVSLQMTVGAALAFKGRESGQGDTSTSYSTRDIGTNVQSNSNVSVFYYF